MIFTGTRDRKVRAIDAQTGRVIWETTVDAALEGMPAAIIAAEALARAVGMRSFRVTSAAKAVYHAGAVFASNYFVVVEAVAQRLLRHALPDALDMLVLCLEGGVSLNAAMQRVTDELQIVHPRLKESMAHA